jgi:hypothetical protein
MENYVNTSQIGENKERNNFAKKFREFILKILKNEGR